MMTTIVTGALGLCAPVFLFLSAYRMTRSGGPGLRGAAVRIAAALLLYWVIFVPRLLLLRAAGQCDLGLVRILREMLMLGSSVVPFSGLFGCYIAGVLLLLCLSRMRAWGPWVTAFFYIALPYTVALTARHYSAQAYPQLSRAMDNLIPHIVMVGAGGTARRMQGRFQQALAGLTPEARRRRLLLVLLAAVMGTPVPTISVGLLQFYGAWGALQLPVGALCASVAVLAARRLVRGMEDVPAAPQAGVSVERPFFSRAVTDAIKGAAVVLMFAHHFFTFPEWFICEGEYPASIGFSWLMNLPLAICVSAFAFLTGYLYARRPREKQTLAYSLQKIREMLVGHGLVLAVLLALAALRGVRISALDALLELVGLRDEISIFNWYVCFYLTAMLLLPLLLRVPHAGPAGTFALTILLPIVLGTVPYMLAPEDSLIAQIGEYLIRGTCGLGAGVLAARFCSFGQMQGRMTARRALGCLLLAAAGIMGRRFAPKILVPLPGLGEAWQLSISMDMLYGPAFVFGVGNLLSAAPGWLLRPLGAVGRESLSMWLLSGAFFGASASLCQPLLYAAGPAPLVLLWGLALCYAGAVLLTALRRMIGKIGARALQNGKNRV